MNKQEEAADEVTSRSIWKSRSQVTSQCDGKLSNHSETEEAAQSPDAEE